MTSQIMRLLLTLRAEQDQKDISLEYHKLQGFVYSHIIKAGHPGIHEKQGYKPFSFSNIFPIGDMEEGEERRLILASPSSTLINDLHRTLSEGIGREFGIGDAFFQLKEIQPLKVSLGKMPLTIMSATPIILRIPEKNYDEYSVPEEERKPRYIYWRPQISFDAFVKQLSENLIKKFNDFYGMELSAPQNPLIEQYFFRKMVHTRIIINNKSYGVASSMWSFTWRYLTPFQRKVIEFGLDAGFGERNSMGFGFVNVVRQQHMK